MCIMYLGLDGCFCIEYAHTFSPLVITPQTIKYNNYLHSIYTALGIVNNLGMI